MTAGRTNTRRDRATLIRRAGLGVAAILFLVPWVLDVPDLAESGERMLGVFLAAIVLWVTEAIPLYATAALIILAEILLISDQAIIGMPTGSETPGAAGFFATLSHPVIMLFLGGFFLAEGAAQTGLDRNLAGILLRPFGTSPRLIILGLMLITGVFSMFMSNTATTATLMAVVLPIIGGLPPGDRLRTALAVSIPVAANVGGMGTPVGTPPNAIAVGSLVDAGVDVSFVGWMVLAVPMMLVVLLIAWQAIVRLFPPGAERLDVAIQPEWDTSRRARLVYAVFVATVGLWMTEPFHGIDASVVGFGAVVALLATGVFDSRDLQAMPWHVLWLVAGGIALGIGVGSSGLDVWMIGLVEWDVVPTVLLTLTLALVALVLSTVISNSAAANLLVPIALTLAASPAVDLEPITVGFLIAIGASLAMALPISTPPNAIAYNTGAVTTADLVKVGAVVGGVGVVLFVFVAPLLWSLMGVAP